jgi:hypothetical protein
MREVQGRLGVLTLLVLLVGCFPVSAAKLRVHVQNANPAENLKTKVIETVAGRAKVSSVIIEGSNKRGLLLDLSQENAPNDLKQIEFVFPGPKKGQKESVLVTFSKELIQREGRPSLTKLRVTKIKQDHDLIQEFSYRPTEDKPCQVGASDFATHHHLKLDILPQKKDVQISNAYTEACE